MWIVFALLLAVMLVVDWDLTARGLRSLYFLLARCWLLPVWVSCADIGVPGGNRRSADDCNAYFSHNWEVCG